MLFSKKNPPREFGNLRIDMFPSGLLETNCYLIHHQKSKQAVIIDPGGDNDTLHEMIRSEACDVQAIWLTHGHYDHIGGLHAIHEKYPVDICIHALDAEMLQNPNDNLSAYFNLPYESGIQNRALSDQQVLSIDDCTITVRHTPGHTRGSVCFLGDGFLISGDTLFRNSIGRSDFPGSSPHDLLKSIHDILLTLPDDTVVFSGHGMYTTIGHERENNPFLK